jgi:hypothetical protein
MVHTVDPKALNVGDEITFTDVELKAVQLLAAVTVTSYAPVMLGSEFVIVGEERPETNVPGPDQL